MTQQSYPVSTNDNILANDHNKVVTDLGDLYSQVGVINTRYVGKASASWTPGTITAGSRNSTDIALTGAAVGDVVQVVSPDDDAIGPLIVSGRVRTANLVRVYSANPTTVNLTGVSGTYTVVLHRY